MGAPWARRNRVTSTPRAATARLYSATFSGDPHCESVKRPSLLHLQPDLDQSADVSATGARVQGTKFLVRSSRFCRASLPASQAFFPWSAAASDPAATFSAVHLVVGGLPQVRP